MRPYIISIVQPVPAAARVASALRGQQQQRAASAARHKFQAMAAARGIRAAEQARCLRNHIFEARRTPVFAAAGLI